MAYADYEYYKDTYLGTAIQETDFPRFSLRASSFLDYYTQGRAAKNAELEAVKMACCALAEQYQVIAEAEVAVKNNLSNASEGQEVSSESVGSWSRSYQSGGSSATALSGAIQEYTQALSDIAKRYLAGTGLLYRGRCFECPCSHTQ